MLHVPNTAPMGKKNRGIKNTNLYPQTKGGGERGTLIITHDGPNGSIDSANIDRLIAEITKKLSISVLRVRIRQLGSSPIGRLAPALLMSS